MMKFRAIALAAALLFCAAAFGHGAQNEIPIAALYGAWAIEPPASAGIQVNDPNLVKTDLAYRARSQTQIVRPVYRELYYQASAEALAASGVGELTASRPVKVFAVYVRAVGPQGGLVEFGPVEMFVPISNDEIEYIFPGAPQRAVKVFGYWSGP